LAPSSTLRDRVVTAIVLIGGFAAALFTLQAIGWTVLAALVLGCAAWEWAGFARCRSGARGAYALATVAAGTGAAWLLQLATGGTGTFTLACVYGATLAFWIIVAPIWLRRRPAAPSPALILAIGWIVLLPTFFAFVQLRNMHPMMLLLFLMTVWIADIAAYFVGSRFGRHKLAPSVSPGKTWEGVAGAFAATTVYALIWTAAFQRYAPAIVRDLPASVVWMLVLIMALTGLSVLGDLFESSLKRQAGLKDSATFLRGHGGLLDRIDALTSVLPAAALVCMI
jgi:phosphatidate cytidylyltransferase